MAAIDKHSEGIILGRETVAQKPKSYQVVILNDDYTTQEFVVSILRSIFYKSKNESISLMLEIHHRERAIVGVYCYDIAMSKVKKATELARMGEFPLCCFAEKTES